MSKPFNKKEEAEVIAETLRVTEEDAIKYIAAKLDIAYNQGAVDFMREQMEANNPTQFWCSKEDGRATPKSV